ncbi:uncharacterized protein [Hemitrygon akajei]|uniref:uncharacterized protein n=1 Tax=Hemitrygon akajei TaxID=2704970 RepID=UPI003BF960F0
MQNKNVAKNDMEKMGKAPTREMTIGDVVLPGGSKRQASKPNQVKLEGHEGAKRTSVAMLKYKPGLAKAHQADKRKNFHEKTFGKDNEELWSTVPGGTEVHFSGYAIRHLKPHSQSSPGKISVARSSSDTSYPQNQIDQIKEIHQQNLPPRPTLSSPSPQPWTEPKKADHNSALLSDANQDVKVYTGPWACLEFLLDILCCKPQKKATILYK